MEPANYVAIPGIDTANYIRRRATEGEAGDLYPRPGAGPREIVRIQADPISCHGVPRTVVDLNAGVKANNHQAANGAIVRTI